ncbi:unnamed protein product [Caenorhabditis sp. 36 PRJEB53466]|nr:unnamed protein product [Caenorhabditis sp. 36 PRJEB53466]
MKFASCLAAVILFLPVVVLQKTDPKAAKPGLHDFIIKKVHDTASYLGFGVTCRNGGHKTEENTCICPKFFRGKECETKQCINGGKLEKVLVPNVHYVCKCPFPEHILGAHCEKIQCENNGSLRTYGNGTWNCDCSTARFHGGTFCERFLLSSGWVMMIICIGVLIIVVFVCSSNWFSRNRANRRRNGSRCPAQGPHATRSTSGSRDAAGRRVASTHRTAHRSSSADDLIATEHGAPRRVAAAYPQRLTQQYVVRLDTIPTFNPSMIGGVEPIVLGGNESNRMGPPPSYDQALVSTIPVQPPKYTPTDTSKANT